MNLSSSMCKTAVALALATLVGCKSDKATDAQPTAPSGDDEPVAASKPAPPTPSARVARTPHRPLLEEVARAELRVGGVLVDFGTSDERKYTRGGWETGWTPAPPPRSAGAPFAVVAGKTARLHFALDAPVKEVVMRARITGAKQRVFLKSATREVAALDVTEEWSVIRAPVVKLEPGRVVVELERQESSGELYIDWLKLANEEGLEAAAPVPRMVPINIGGKVRRSLAAPTARTFSFYLHVPEKASLVFDVGAKAAVDFAVTAYDVDDGEAHDLFSETATPGTWNEHDIDLGQFGGKAIRLDFITRGDELTAAGWGEPTIYRAEAPAAPTNVAAAKKPKNVVFVVMDTTRADAFAPHYPDNEIKTPVFDRLARESTAFVNAYNNENWTKPSVATMFSGLYPVTHTARTAVANLPEEVRFFTENLQKKGFETAAFSANAVFSEKFGFNRGWSSFNNLSDSAKEGNGYYLYRRAAKWLEDREDPDKPFFLYVQSVDPHTTYDVPGEYSSLYYEGDYKGKLGDSFDREEQVEVDKWSLKLDEKDLAWVRALYWGEVSFQDEQLGVLLAKLDELGVADDTMVIVTNDHGEELFEHKHMGHGWTLYDEMIRAPLVIRYPPLFEAGKQIDDVIEHVDLAPTILAAVGAPPMKDIEGASFLELASGGTPSQILPSYSIASSRKRERSIRVGRYKLIDDDDQGWRGLYDVVGDPGETRDLRRKAPLAGRLAEIYLGEGLAVPDKRYRLQNVARVRKLPARDAKIDPVLRKKLEALGYL